MKIALATLCPQKHEDAFSNHDSSFIDSSFASWQNLLTGAAAGVRIGAGRHLTRGGRRLTLAGEKRLRECYFDEGMHS